MINVTLKLVGLMTWWAGLGKARDALSGWGTLCLTVSKSSSLPGEPEEKRLWLFKHHE